MNASQVITILTDFGLADPFVGVMKGIIHGIHPDARVIDLTHEIEPQDIRAGAFNLLVSYRYFPPGTVHLGVVDPGVGTERRALAIVTNRYLLVGPDNGVLTWAAMDDEILYSVSITRDEYLLADRSTTFHGRDIFAPAAAHLSLGVAPDKLGERIDDPVVLDFPEPNRRDESSIVGRTIYIDRFGNLITNVRLSEDEKSRVAEITMKDVSISHISTTYHDADPGKPMALVGSTGFVEIACSEASAADILRAKRDDVVIFHFED